MRKPFSLVVVMTLVSGVASAEDKAGEAQHPQPPVAVPAPPTPVDETPHILRLGRPRGVSRAARPDAKLGGVRALEIREGEAVLVLPEGQRTVRPGDVVSGDKVRMVEPGRVVLARPEAGGGPPAIVIVRFDAAGRGRVTVYSSRDKGPAAPPKPAGE